MIWTSLILRGRKSETESMRSNPYWHNMSNEEIIRKLWSVIFDLLLYINGHGKPIEEIWDNIQLLENVCERS